MMRIVILVSLLVFAVGCAPSGGARSRPVGILDPIGPIEPRLADVFAGACAALDAGTIAVGARSQGFAVADAATRDAVGAFHATTLWVRGAPASPDFINWRQEDGVCEVFGPVASQDAAFRAFLRFLAPQNVVYQTLDQPRANRFAYVRLERGVVHSLGFGVARLRFGNAVLLSRRRVPDAPSR